MMDLCYEKSALTFTDLERLRAERSRPDRVKLFIAILKSKSDVKSYEVFVEALTDKRVQQGFIKKRLDESVVTEHYEEGNTHSVCLSVCLSVSLPPSLD